MTAEYNFKILDIATLFLYLRISYARNVFHLNYEVACTRWHALGGMHYRPLWRTTNTFQCFPVRIYPWQPAQIHDLFTEDCQCPRVSVISMIRIYRWQLAQIHDIFTIQYLHLTNNAIVFKLFIHSGEEHAKRRKLLDRILNPQEDKPVL